MCSVDLTCFSGGRVPSPVLGALGPGEGFCPGVLLRFFGNTYFDSHVGNGLIMLPETNLKQTYIVCTDSSCFVKQNLGFTSTSDIKLIASWLMAVENNYSDSHQQVIAAMKNNYSGSQS